MFVSNFDSWHNLYFCLNWVEFRSTVYPVVVVGSLTHDLAITVMRRRERTWTKVIMQGKLFQRCTHLVYCSVLSLGSNVNTRRMSKPAMGSIVHIKNQWNILVIGNYYVNYQNYENLMLLSPRILHKHWCIYSRLQSPPTENWFQCVRSVYANTINFPCIITLTWTMIHDTTMLQQELGLKAYIAYSRAFQRGRDV